MNQVWRNIQTGRLHKFSVMCNVGSPNPLKFEWVGVESTDTE